MLRNRKTKQDNTSGSAARSGWARTAAPGEPRLPMRTRQVVGHVTLTGNTGTAWYRLDPVPWSFRPDRDREQHILAQASVLAGLSGQLVRLRGTQVPFPVREWAQAHHRLVTERQAAFGAVPLPCWPDLLAGEQRQFLGEHLAEKQVYLGVDYLHRSPLAQLAAGVLPRSWRPLARELNTQHAKLAALDTLMARPGMRGKPVTAAQMAWLLHRSTHLGFPAPRLRTRAGCRRVGTRGSRRPAGSGVLGGGTVRHHPEGHRRGGRAHRVPACGDPDRRPDAADDHPAGGSAVDGDPGPAGHPVGVVRPRLRPAGP